MTAANRILRSYGESITIGTAEGRGFISCLDADDAQIHKAHLAPGVTNNSKYRLITDAEGIAEGDAVTAGGRRGVCLHSDMSSCVSSLCAYSARFRTMSAY